MSASVRGRYDHSTHMYCQAPYEDLYKLEFMRHLAETGKIGDRGVVSDPKGKYAPENRKHISAIEDKVEEFFHTPVDGWVPNQYINCGCTFIRSKGMLLPVSGCIVGERVSRDLYEGAFWYVERKILDNDDSTENKKEIFRHVLAYWGHFGK